MINQPKLLASIITGCIAGVMLLIGVPLWIVGLTKPKFICSTVLYSIPVYPKSSEKYSYWIGGIPNGNNTIDFFQDFSINFNLSFFNQESSSSTFYFLHNFHGYDISIEILDDNLKPLCTFTGNNNPEIGITTNTSIKYVHPLELASELRSFGEFRVVCQYPTLITTQSGIGNQCNQEYGYFLELKDKLSPEPICELSLEDLESNLVITFHNISIVPYDFIQTPQMYIGAWKQTDSKEMLISGISMTGIGIAGIVVFGVLLFIHLFVTN